MKMWDGRFSKPNDRLMEQFNNSLPFDKNLIEEDIRGSIAWAHGLCLSGIYNKEEFSKVKDGLLGILADYKQGKIEFLSQDEDIHMAVERILVERIGETGSRLHTGRSRNDQVATDTHLYVMKSANEIRDALVVLQKAVLGRAESDKQVIAPGYTHLQQAQPIILSHYWLSLFFLLEREKSRLDHAVKTSDVMPLGSGAIAGTGFRVDRNEIAKELGFSRISENSIDGVASRDFILETLSSIASIGIHLSRYAEDLIIWSSKEFGFVELDDAWSTGSSMMPQKKNPDSLELIRGKSGRFIGNYMRFAATLKGVGLTYYKDLQEDKEPLFDSVEQILMVLNVFSQVIATLNVNDRRIKEDLDPFLLATDLADYLVCKGVPFRQAHKVVGRVVAFCIENNRSMLELTVGELKSFSELFGEDVKATFTWESALAHRNIAGGTGRESVENQLCTARKCLSEFGMCGDLKEKM